MDTTNMQKNTKTDLMEALEEQCHIPVQDDESGPGKLERTPTQKAIRKTFKLTAYLANLLPTGTVLAFQMLSPAFTHEGKCFSNISKYMTSGLLCLCGFSCFVLCFTDSFRDEHGKVRYAIATWRGLRVIDGSRVSISPQDAEKYRLKWVDFFHGFLSLIVFSAVALLDQNVLRCFFPTPSDEIQDYLITLPVAAGIVCSFLFIAFPTTRHAIGFRKL